MTLSPWYLAILAIPVLLVGEATIRRVRWLRYFNIPAPVVGGFAVSLLLLATTASGFWPAHFETIVHARWWTWIVTPEPEWLRAPGKAITLPLLVGFFTCIGLNASWSLARRGSFQVLVFLAAAVVLSVLQNLVGAGLAMLMGEPPLLGLACGSVSLSGGHGTAMGFAADFERAGLEGATVIGMAAATFGLVAGSLLGGPLAGALVRRHGLHSDTAKFVHLERGDSGQPGILQDLAALPRFGRAFGVHLLTLLLCIKAGAWVSTWIQQAGLTFPVYIGAMLVGVLTRNIVDAVAPGVLRTEVIDTIGSVLLGIFLSMAMMSLNLVELANTAAPMLVILLAQVGLIALFAWTITFRIMGKDYEAAVMAGGQCGFGLGATVNAIATMKTIVESFGPAPRSFLVVPIVGSFLLDLCNALNITFFLNIVAR